MKEISKTAREIQQKLRLKTNILGIKLLQEESEIPGSAIRPLDDNGYHLDLCQALGKSRLEGETIAMLKKDMWCFEPVVGLGLAEPSERFLAGENRYPWSVYTREDASKWAHSLPRLEVGKYIGLVSAPLVKAEFEADMFMIFCDPEQLTHILITKNCIDGEDVDSTLSGHAGCVYAIVPTIKEQKCKVTSPCRGFRSYAMTQSDELIYSGPVAKLSDYVEAMEHLQKHDWDFPYTRHIQPERRLNDNYAEIGKEMGLDY